MTHIKPGWAGIADHMDALMMERDTAISRAEEAEARVLDLYAALKAAVDCGMVPKVSAADGGPYRYLEQVAVADLIRDAMSRAEVQFDL